MTLEIDYMGARLWHGQGIPVPKRPPWGKPLEVGAAQKNTRPLGNPHNSLVP